MNTRGKVWSTACAAAFLGGAVWAAVAEANTGQDQLTVPASPTVISTSTLVGSPVLDPRSQQLGRIKDVLLDPRSGRATFMVIDAQAPGTGHAMLVVPYEALQIGFYPGQDRVSVVLDLQPGQVQAAPQIRDDQWSMLQDPRFLQRARSFYQVTTYTAARPIENATQAAPPNPCPLPPSQTGAYAGWPQHLIEFGSE